jgi:hypothetical protein
VNAARAVFGGLVLANLLYFVWALGGLAVFGAAPQRLRDTEPQRLAQQIRPGSLRIRATGDARPAAAAPAPAAAASAATGAAPSPAPTTKPDEPTLTQQFDHR